MRSRPIHRIALLLLFLTLVVTTGTLGFMRLLDVGFIDGLYMTIITISTVGYTEVAPMNEGAQLFSIGLIILAIKKAADERFKFNPTGNTVLDPGDKIIVIGEEVQIDMLRELAQDIRDE